MVQGRGRGEYRVTERVDAAITMAERTVVFQDRPGGAMHAPGAEILYRLDRAALGRRRLRVRRVPGASTSPAIPSPSRTGSARGPAYRISRHLLADAFAGPAYWSGPDGRALVPEAGAELELSNRQWDLRAGALHGLGIGTTARPGLVDSVEVGFVRRLGATHTFDLRGDGGIRRSGQAPSGANSTLGFAATGSSAGAWPRRCAWRCT